MGEITELTVTRGKTVKVPEREEWSRVEYTVKASIDSSQELDVAKAMIEGRLDGWLANVMPSTPTTEKAKIESSLPGTEDLSQLPWQSYQTKERAKPDESAWIFADTKGAETLLASLKTKDKVRIAHFEYILRQGQNKKFISRNPLK